MGRKQDIYIPQFDLDNIDEISAPEYQICQKCGRKSALNGVCFLCSRNEKNLKTNAAIIDSQINKKTSIYFVLAIGIGVIIAIILTFLIAFGVIPTTERVVDICTKASVGFISGIIMSPIIWLFIKFSKPKNNPDDENENMQ